MNRILSTKGTCWVIVFIIFLNGCLSKEGYFLRKAHRKYRNGNYESAIKNFTAALKLNSQNAKTFYNRGNTFLDMGNTDQAIADYTKALELNRELFQAYNNRGFVWSQKGNYDYAISDYTKAIEINPGNVRSYFARANLWYKKGNYDLAISDYTKVIEIDPNNPKKAKVYYLLAEAWYENNNYDNSIVYYNKAIEISPNFSEAVFNRGNIWYEKENFTKAISDYNNAIEIDPQYAHVYSNYSWLLSTCMDVSFRDGAKAVKLAQKAVELQPDEPLYLDNLAAAYAESGNFEQAVQTMGKAILLLPHDSKKEIKEFFTAHLESYKAGNPWRENTKTGEWMRDYKLELK